MFSEITQSFCFGIKLCQELCNAAGIATTYYTAGIVTSLL